MASSFPDDDEAAAARFEAAALPFMNVLYNKALYLSRRPEDASDLVQKTFLRADRTFANFAEGTNCKAWLFTILYSIFVNKYRKAQREPANAPAVAGPRRGPRGSRNPFPSPSIGFADWVGPGIGTWALGLLAFWL